MKTIVVRKPKGLYDGVTQMGLKVKRLPNDEIEILNYTGEFSSSIFLNPNDIDDLISALKSVKR